MNLKLKDGYVLHEIAGEYLLLPEQSVDLSALLNLNETGAFLWKLLQTQTDKQALTAALVKEYSVDEKTAAKDTEDFILRLKELDLLA